MKTHVTWTHLLAGAFCAASLCGAAFAQELPPATPHISGTQPFHAAYAGTCTNKDDFSLTGAPLFNGTNYNSGALRVFCNFAGNGTHGEFTGQLVADDQPTTSTCTLPGGGTGGKAVVPAWLFVLSFNERQDQLFLSSNSGTDCANFAVSPPMTYPQATFTVMGGTGRFEGASGTISFVDKSIILAFSRLATVGVFAANSGTLDGFITLK